MKTLTIVRHAKSSWDDPNLTDRQRPLNLRGKKSAPKMGKRMADAGIAPSLIVSSPAVRAWVTAEIIAEELGYSIDDIVAEDRMYHASVPEILEVIAHQNPECDHLMIVGHNPGLTDLVNHFSPNLTWNLPTAGVVTFRIDRADWDLSNADGAELVFYDYPKKKH